MQLRERDEEKRSRSWRITMLVTSLIIIFILVYFGLGAMKKNPLHGEWRSAQAGYTVKVREDVLFVDMSGEGQMDMELKYTLDKKSKVVTIAVPAEINEQFTGDSDGVWSARESNAAAYALSFDFSLEGDTLILSDREYGEQIILVKE